MSKRIETKVSITAQATCLTRAISYFEANGAYKGDDWVAPKLIWPVFRLLAKHNVSREFLKKRFLRTQGMYEYLIARTKFIDAIFLNIAANVEQVLIFGAGFDSRAIRFQDQLANASVFELDAPVTQQAKIARLKRKYVEFPSNLRFIAIDFTKESLAEKLAEAGFEKNRTCLFLLEGLTYYLDQASIDATFTLISEISAPGSMVVFDYGSAEAIRAERALKDPAVIKHYEFLAKMGERPGFAVEGNIRDFLARYNFGEIDEADANELIYRFFAEKDVGLITKKFRIVTAKKV